MKQIIFFILVILMWRSAISQITIQNGATLYLSGSAQVTLNDADLVNNGTITIAANGRFIFTGSVNSFILGSQNPAFNELEIAKAGSNKIILQRTIAVNGKIVFTSGLIDLNNNIITLGSAAFLENENQNRRVTGTNGGHLVHITTLNAPPSVNSANLGATITSSQNLGTVTIHRGHQFYKIRKSVMS